jgi:hypothetical protein
VYEYFPNLANNGSQLMSTTQLIAVCAMLVGVFWSIAYALIIRQAHRDKNYGMPFAAMCFNIAWEFVYAFIFPQPAPQLYINVLWFVLDGIMLYQFLRFGRYVVAGTLFERYFYPLVVAALTLSVAFVWTGYLEFNDIYGRFTAYPANMVMSALFIAMLIRRNDVSGQSMYIAIFKLLGTGSSALAVFLILNYAPFLKFCYVGILALDIVYCIALYAQFRRMGLNPFTRRPLKPQPV